MQNKWDAARQVLISGSIDVPANAYWNKICQDEGVGQRRASRWHLSSGDLELLRAIISRETGVDPLLQSLPQDRMSQALEAGNEKLAQSSVFATKILVAKRHGPILMQDGSEGRTPSGTCLAVPASQLDLRKETMVIVVENGCVIQHWHRVNVPTDWQQALWCYRGHGNNAADLRSILRENTHLRVAWFCDLDPAGLVMSMQAESDVMVPDLAASKLCTEHFLKKYNKLPTFLMQQKYTMPGEQSALRQSVWNYVQLNKIAITQETMIATGLSIVVI